MTVVELIEQTLMGDQRAFEQLFEGHKNLVYKAAFLILDDVDETEDALQDVFLKAYRALGTYDPSKGAFTTWLYRITVNHCLSQRRRLTRFLRVRERTVERALPSHEGEIDDAQELRGALDQLSLKLRTVLVLRFFLDLSYAEMAQTLSIPLGTVKSRISLALTKVRHELRDDKRRALPAKKVME
jgi:RNA polymerase sigma-70 factor (ECF subfamily)